MTGNLTIFPEFKQLFSGTWSTYSPNFMEIDPQLFNYPGNKQIDK